MTKENFIERFKEALNQTVDFTHTLAINDLPLKYKFNLYRVDLKYSQKRLDFMEALDVLFEDGQVPKWINISVVKVDGEYTIIACDYSEVYTNDDSMLQFSEDPLSPFSITGPLTSKKPINSEKFYLEEFDEEKGWFKR